MADPIRVICVWKGDGSYYFSDEEGNPRRGDMNPAELLTAAVVSCTGKTMHAIMNKMKIGHGGFTITGEARMTGEKISWVDSVQLDTSIKGSQISDAQRVRLQELTEKYCFLTQTLRRGADVALKIGF